MVSFFEILVKFYQEFLFFCQKIDLFFKEEAINIWEQFHSSDKNTKLDTEILIKDADAKSNEEIAENFEK